MKIRSRGRIFHLCSRHVCRQPLCYFTKSAQRQPLYPKMRNLVAFRHCPREVNLSKGNHRTLKWGNWLPFAIVPEKPIRAKATSIPGNGEFGCLSPLSQRSQSEQRQPVYPEMGKLVAFRRCPKEVNLSKGNHRTLKWGNWLPFAIVPEKSI